MFVLRATSLGATENSGADVQATPVAVLTKTATPTPQPTPCSTFGTTCSSAYAAYWRRHPEVQHCLLAPKVPPDADERAYNYICCVYKQGRTTAARFTDTWNQYVAQRCPPTPPPPVTDSPPPLPPPPTPENYDEPPLIRVDDPVDGGEGDTGSTPVSQKNAALKTWGPIVGIGLIAAIGLTLARKRSLTKKRRRR